uniref:PDZ domain-containing protein n=1 Tax=Alexandrium catenella TaxID=2925 RepID=A0A7S1R7C1_ALECA
MEDLKALPPLMSFQAFDKPTGKSLHAPPSRTVSTCTWDRSMADLGTSSASFDGASAQDPVSIDVQPLEFMLGQPEEFTEYLIKGGKTLGVSLSYGKHDDFLLITKIGDGLVQELNDRGACQIRVFDAIVQVNGVRDDAAEMLDRLSKADALELVLVRYVGEEQLDGLLSKQQPDAGPGAPSTAPRPPSAALPRMLSEQYTLSIGQPWPHEKLPRLLSEQ